MLKFLASFESIDTKSDVSIRLDKRQVVSEDVCALEKKTNPSVAFSKCKNYVGQDDPL